MTTVEVVQTLTLLVAVFTGIIIPFLMRQMNNADKDRQDMKRELHDRLDHLDGCTDETKRLVLSRMMTKDDFADYRKEMQETLTRVREAVSLEQRGIHERVMRLEARFLGGPGSG